MEKKYSRREFLRQNLATGLGAALPFGLTSSLYEWLSQEKDKSIKLVHVKKIWDKAPHNAFTDLLRFKGKWFCAFREAKDHWSEGANGKIRVITSSDGNDWHSVALMSKEGDLRDPKLSITPENKLMLLCFRRFNPSRYPDQHEQTFAYFSSNGSRWSDPVAVGFPDRWLWRVTWHEGRAYGISKFGPKGKKPLSDPHRGRMLVSEDGKSFKPFTETGYGDESTIRFAKNETAYCLKRTKKNGLIGVANPPYKEWQWKNLGKAIGGPEMIILPDGRLLAAGRLYEGGAHTSLCWIDPQTGEFTEALKLPSGGDTSYPGLVLHNGLLWVSYYSTHEEKTAIYLAKVKIEK